MTEETTKPSKHDRRDPTRRGRNAFETCPPRDVEVLLAGIPEKPGTEQLAEALRRKRRVEAANDPGRRPNLDRPPRPDRPANDEDEGAYDEDEETYEGQDADAGSDVETKAEEAAIARMKSDLAKLNPSLAAIVFKYNPRMPRPAVVALLEKNLERGNRATAAIVHGFLYHAPDGQTIKVPIGYITDFASIPMLFRWLIAPFGRHARAAILHDWLYAVGEKDKRGYADQIAFDALKDLDVDAWIRWTIFIAVRVGGIWGYGKQKEWDTSWADWKTGDGVKPPKHKREEFWNGQWPNDPDLGH